MNRDLDGAKRRRWGCVGLAALGLLAAVTACSLGYARARHIMADPPLQPRPLRLNVGPIKVMSGLTALDPCASFGVTVPSWRCGDMYFTHGQGEPIYYRLWLITTGDRKGVQTYELVNIAVVPAAPACAEPSGVGC